MIDFPDSPTLNQVFQGPNGVSYTWNGTLWLVQNTFAGGTGDFYGVSSASDFAISTTYITLPITSIVSGNAGAWYGLGTTSRFIPPAGRYNMFAGYMYYGSGTNTTGYIHFRKNGVMVGVEEVVHQPTAGNFMPITIAGNFDCNGTDYFEVFIKSLAGTNGRNCYFGAFPLTGMQGPSGAPGAAGQSLLLYWSAASTALSSTASTFGWDVVGENTTGGSYTSGTGLFTIPTGMGGLWDVSFCMQLTGSATVGLMALRVNAADVANVASPATNSNGVTMALNGRFRFAAGDVVSSRVSGTATTTAYGTSGGTNRASWLHLTRVGA